MNDTLKQATEAAAPAEKPAPEKFRVAAETASDAKVPERLPKPAASFLETVYYWVITRA